jgi:hypothetical protein
MSWVQAMRPKARRLAQNGGPPGWFEESDPAGRDFVRDGRSMPPDLMDHTTCPVQRLICYKMYTKHRHELQCKEGMAWHSSWPMPSLWVLVWILSLNIDNTHCIDIYFYIYFRKLSCETSLSILKPPSLLKYLSELGRPMQTSCFRVKSCPVSYCQPPPPHPPPRKNTPNTWTK